MSKEREPASGARRATGGAPEERRDGRGRWSAKCKFEAVLRLLRGEDLETLSRELGVTAATLSGWRDQFLEGGAGNRGYSEQSTLVHECQNFADVVIL
jgi:transposase-like protein